MPNEESYHEPRQDDASGRVEGGSTLQRQDVRDEGQKPKEGMGAEGVTE